MNARHTLYARHAPGKNRLALLPVRNGGSVMLVALVFLVMLTLATTHGMRSSTMELRMAGNEETQVRTFELTQALLEATVNNSANFPMSDRVGHRNCTANVVGCDLTNITLSPGLMLQASSDKARIIVERMAPAWSPPPRGSDSSIETFLQARFEVQATYGDSTDGSGRVTLVQGVSILVPHGTQGN